MNRRMFVRRLLGAGASLMVPAEVVSATRYFFMGDPARRAPRLGRVDRWWTIALPSCTIAMELDPLNAPGVFTTIAELRGDLPEFGVATAPPPKGLMESLAQGPATLSVNYIYDDGRVRLGSLTEGAGIEPARRG